MEVETGLERVEVGGGDVKSFVFISKDLEHKSNIVLMIHGSGVVRAGQWARRLIINEVRNTEYLLSFSYSCNLHIFCIISDFNSTV